MSLFCRAVFAILLSGMICFSVDLNAAPPIRPEPGKSEGQKDEAKPDKPADEFDQAALEKKFTEDMSGVVFAGSFSITRDNTEAPAEMEKYTITRVSKGENGLWTFQTRIQYGKHDLALPIALKVKWAGDTPVITLTDLTIPGLGTFTSRVLIYGDRYAGTWQHGKVGGHLWGRIEKIEKVEKPAAAEAGKDGDTASKKPSGK